MPDDTVAKTGQHLTDEELLRSADGELSPHETDDVRRHLQACWECRSRSAEIEASVVTFVQLHHAELDAKLPPAEGPRALLKARMAESSGSAPLSWRVRWYKMLFTPRFAYLGAGLLMVGFSAGLWLQRTGPSQLPSRMQVAFDRPEPDRRLTPGSYRVVPLQQVCTSAQYEQARVTSISLKQRVFEEYGLRGAPLSNYEVDFLVTPELGGTDDIKNLWPEPYSSTVWNAHVKDELEDRLHDLVCEQKLDLATAQRDIATDWVAAYKKYFHTDHPLVSGDQI